MIGHGQRITKLSKLHTISFSVVDVPVVSGNPREKLCVVRDRFGRLAVHAEIFDRNPSGVPGITEEIEKLLDPNYTVVNWGPGVCPRTVIRSKRSGIL